ncbi:MAG TPA: hypothetical protein VFR37_16475, partial [Longimicrobium sp.]|nr:hypothetical protein [Longimicrobium sp.]
VAVDPCGREICVPDLMCVRLNRWLDRHRAALEQLYPVPEDQPIPLAVVLCHRECPTDTVPVPGEPCRSQDDAMQPSRIREGFELRLMLRDDAPWAASPPPDATGLGVWRLHQPEEQAVRAFGRLLARVQTTTDPELSQTGRDELLEGVRALEHAADEPVLASPPALNDDPILLPAATAADILREAMRVWVTEVRPAIRRQEDPGVCGDADGECCVLLAELDLPVTSAWAVRTGTIAPDQEGRPYLLHTRLLQEWLIARGGQEGRPDVDSFATLEILGPSQVRAWLHHDGWLGVRKEAITFVLNDAALAPEQIVSVAYAGTRNVWDVLVSETMADGDVVEIRFDTRELPLVNPPDPGESPADSDPLLPPQTVADELRGPTGEYLDRYGWTLSAFAVYDKIEGGDLDQEYRVPKVVKIQGYPVSDRAPRTHDVLHYRDGAWNPDQLDEWTVDLRDAYPGTRVTGLQTHPVADTEPEDLNYLVYARPTERRGQWEPRPLPPATGDVSGVYPSLRVVGIQGAGVSASASDGTFLRLNRPDARTPGTWDAITFVAQGGDVTGSYPAFLVTALRGTPLSGTAPTANQVLAFRGGSWTPTGVAAALGPAAGDLDGSYPAPTVAGLRGRPIADAPDPSDGDVLVYRESLSPPGSGEWVPGTLPLAGDAGGDLDGDYPAPTVVRLRGRAISTAAPADGQVLVFQAASNQWVPAAQAGGAAGPAGGDLGGTYPNPTVGGLRGRGIATTAPPDGQVLVFQAASNQWVPAAQAGGATGAAGGDLGGTYPNPTVGGLRGRVIATTAPTDGQVLVFQAASNTWVPGARGGPPTGNAGGDLGGSYPNPSVNRLRGRAIATTVPTDGQVLIFQAASQQWVPAAPRARPGATWAAPIPTPPWA